jgi:hypothetical protein
MDERDWLAEQFEEQRSHLRAVAYRMLGSVHEADSAGGPARRPVEIDGYAGTGLVGGRRAEGDLRLRASRRQDQ